LLDEHRHSDDLSLGFVFPGTRLPRRVKIKLDYY
jgi:hypothetical protein